MAKETKTMTNLEYAKTLTRNELPLIIRVAKEYIEKLVGPNASRDNREKAYVKWCVDTYDPDVWYKDLRKKEVYFYGV